MTGKEQLRERGIEPELLISPECHEETMFFMDIIRDLARTQQKCAGVLGEPKINRAQKLDNTLKEAKEEILGNLGIKKDKLEAFANDIEKIREDVRKYPVTVPVLEETINAIQRLVKRTVVPEMLLTFKECSCEN